MAWRRTPFVFCCSRSFGTGIPSQFDLDNLAAAINDLAISADYTLANYSANSKQLNFSYLPFQLASRHTFSQRGPRRPHSHSNSKKTKDPQTRQNQARSHPIINESLKRTKKKHHADHVPNTTSATSQSIKRNTRPRESRSPGIPTCRPSFAGYKNKNPYLAGPSLGC